MKMKKVFALIFISVLFLTGLTESLSVYAETVKSSELDIVKTETNVSSASSSDEKAEVSAAESTSKYPSKGKDTFINYSLPILIYGMLGIFLVLGLIALCIYFLGRLSNKENKSSNE